MRQIGSRFCKKGARQIGKTWAMETFGKIAFDHCANLILTTTRVKVFFKLLRILRASSKELSLYTEVPIIAGKTLIIFDEIQECEEAFSNWNTSTKMLLSITLISLAGSLLGSGSEEKCSGSSGKSAHTSNAFTFSFREFLRSSDEKLFEYVEDLQR